MNKKMITVSLCVGILSFSAGVLPKSEFIQPNYAEAGIFSGLRNLIGDDNADKVEKSAKRAGEKAIGNALGIDIADMGSHEQNMKRYLGLAAAKTAAAEYKAYIACDESENSRAPELGMIANSLMENPSDVMKVYHLAEIPGCSDALAPKVKGLMNEQDAAKKDVAVKQLRWAKNDRTYATFYKGLALREATIILKSTVKGLAHPKSVNDIVEQLQQFSNLANDTKKLCDNIGARTGAMNKMLRAYEKANNIKAPSKDEIKKGAEALRAE